MVHYARVLYQVLLDGFSFCCLSSHCFAVPVYQSTKGQRSITKTQVNLVTMDPKQGHRA